MAEPKTEKTEKGAPGVPERYEEIVQRLSGLVEKLEGGQLSLEDAVNAFEQGVTLARAGAQKLDEAERRVEILLSGEKTQAFDPQKSESAPRTPEKAGSRRARSDDDAKF